MRRERAVTNPPSEQGRVRPGLLRGYRHVLAAFALCLAAGAVSLGAPVPAAAEGCPNAVFRTGPSAHLPDCRAYEMVTPLFKGGGRVLPGAVAGISPDGSALVLPMTEALAETEGFPNLSVGGPYVTYSMRRTASGWTYAPEDPPTSEYLPFFVDGFSNEAGAGLDARTMLWLERGAGRPTNSIEIYKREASGAIVDVGPTLPPTAPFGERIIVLGAQAKLSPVGVSADGSHVLFNLSKEHWPFDHSQEGFSSQGVASLYEYAGTGNTTPMLVGVDNAGNQISGCGTVLGGGGPPSEVVGSQVEGAVEGGHNAVSSDGETVFFTAYPPSLKCSASTLPVPELFARIDNGQLGAHTVAVSEASAADCSACDTQANVLAQPVYLGASADGSKVFFESTQALLGGDGSENIYEYDFSAPAGQRVVRVSGGDATVSGPTAGVEGPVEVSEDGSHVYFIAQGVLTTKPNGFGQSAQPGAKNLYVFERDARYPGGRTAFVAELSGDQLESLWTGNNLVSGGQSRANLTPDGRFLLFTSNTDLTPDDTSTAQQVFEYDSVTGTLVRVSVGRDGFNDNGNATSGEAEIVGPGSYKGGSSPSDYSAHRSLSADGAYVFFQSPVGLTPEAFNDKPIKSEEEKLRYAENVYEYHDGVVSLISDGQDITDLGSQGSNVTLVGIDESGADVFFETADRLVGQDTDSNVDLYDARVGGGFPAPPTAASCSGEACQGQLSGAPTLLSPGSEFQAGGNPPLSAPEASKPKPKAKARAKGCRKGFAKKHGRCVKQRAKARKASRDRRTKS
jgi:hypothetical protein